MQQVWLNVKMETIEDEMRCIGDKTQQAVHLMNIVSCIWESKHRGENDPLLIGQLKMKVNYYISRYGSQPPDLSYYLSEAGILQN
jgi:hypothetical protein